MHFLFPQPSLPFLLSQVLCNGIRGNDDSNALSVHRMISKRTLASEMLMCSVVVLAVSSAISAADNEVDRQPKLGLLNTGTSTIAQLAQDLLSRGTSSSQVLSLNLTNLVILVVIKALIFGAGHLGLGGYDGGLGRSVDNAIDKASEDQQSFLSMSDVQIMLSYLQGDMTHNYGCLHYSACTDPRRAQDYLSTARILSKGAQAFGVSNNGDKYDQVLSAVQDAIDFGKKGYDCSVRYSCQGNSR